MNDDDRFGASRVSHKESKRSFDASIMIRRLSPLWSADHKVSFRISGPSLLFLSGVEELCGRIVQKDHNWLIIG